jgi:translation initiation factor 3 subunit H
MVKGSLLGLVVENGVLEISYSFPFPSDPSHKQHGGGADHQQHPPHDDETAGLDGTEYQLEMMRMLKDVHVDNNCVGWYQSMYLGIFSTASLLEEQLGYQTDLSPNAVVLLYDPMQTTHGNLVLKCLRLTEECLKLSTADGKSNSNAFINPKRIFEEVPVTLSNPSLVQAFLTDVRDGLHHNESLDGGAGALSSSSNYNPNGAVDTTFDRLDLSTNPYLEKHLEYLSGWVDNLAAEQIKFQYYSRQLLRKDKQQHHQRRNNNSNNKKGETTAEDWEEADAPRRLESLLIANQISTYCDQMDGFIGEGLNKLFLANGLHSTKK